MAARGDDRTLSPPFFYRLTAAQWLAIDVAVAILACAVGLFDLRGALGLAHRGTSAAPWVWVALGTLPVAVRRLWPRTVLGLVTAALTVLAVEGQSPFVVDVTLALASYTVATRFRRRVTVPSLIAVVLALGIGSAVGSAGASAQTGAMHFVLVAVAAWFVGDSVRSRRTYVTGLQAQARERDRVRAERARAAVRDERVRIARDLHDVVAHSLGVITVQAGVGRRVIEARPDQARDALASVEVTGRAASDELRRIVGLLRENEPEPARLAPAPGLDDLAALVERVRDAGVPVRLSVLGAPGDVPATVGLSTYRIVQEALTNVVKHAPAARASVTVDAAPDGVRIRVLNDGAVAAVNGDGAGHGIVGMRERAALFGGALSARPRVDGGFEVTAFLPSRAE